MEDDSQKISSNNRYIFGKFAIIFVTILTFAIIDIVFSIAATYVSVSSNNDLTLYLIIAVCYIGGRHLIFKYVKEITRNVKRGAINSLNQIIILFQYVITFAFSIIVIEILLTSQYHTFILQFAVITNLSISTLVIGILSFKFVMWYRLEKNFLLLTYSLAFASLAISFTFLLILNFIVLSILPEIRNVQSSPSPFPFFDQGILGLLQYYSAITNFMPSFILWVGATLLLYHYSKKIGKIQFGIIMSIPIVFFVFQPVVLGPSLADSSNLPFLIDILGNILPGLIGGILVGIPFFFVAKSMNNNILRDHLTIAGFGFVILNIATSSGVPHAPYLPFGLSTVLLLSLGCYLILISIYYTAISISANTIIRNNLRKSLNKESALFNSIGMAQAYAEVELKVKEIAKTTANRFEQQIGVEPYISHEDIQQHINEVLDELGKK